MMSEVYKPGRKQQWFNLAFNEDAGEAAAYLYDDIGGYGITAKDFIEEVNYLKAGKLNVRINSYGGEIDQGVAIYNFLKDYEGDVNVYVDGIAASIASVIAMAGDKVIMGEAALMFIHNPWTMAAGDAADFEKEAANLQKRKAALIDIYAAKTGMDREFISNLMDDESLLNAEEAVELGFATAIDKVDQPEMAFNSSMYNKIVSAMARKITTKENNMAEENQPEVEALEEIKAESVETAAPESPVDETQEVEVESVDQVEEPVADDVCEEVPNARAEFNEFVDAFGMERAAKYFAAGLDLEEAKASYMDEIVSENKQLREKLSSVETVKPVSAKVSDESDAPVTFSREQIRNMSAEDYRKHRNAINKAQAEGKIV